LRDCRTVTIGGALVIGRRFQAAACGGCRACGGDRAVLMRGGVAVSTVSCCVLVSQLMALLLVEWLPALLKTGECVVAQMVPSVVSRVVV